MRPAYFQRYDSEVQRRAGASYTEFDWRAALVGAFRLDFLVQGKLRLSLNQGADGQMFVPDAGVLLDVLKPPASLVPGQPLVVLMSPEADILPALLSRHRRSDADSHLAQFVFSIIPDEGLRELIYKELPRIHQSEVRGLSSLIHLLKNIGAPDDMARQIEAVYDTLISNQGELFRIEVCDESQLDVRIQEHDANLAALQASYRTHLARSFLEEALKLIPRRNQNSPFRGQLRSRLDEKWWEHKDLVQSDLEYEEVNEIAAWLFRQVYMARAALYGCEYVPLAPIVAQCPMGVSPLRIRIAEGRSAAVHELQWAPGFPLFIQLEIGQIPRDEFSNFLNFNNSPLWKWWDGNDLHGLALAFESLMKRIYVPPSEFPGERIVGRVERWAGFSGTVSGVSLATLAAGIGGMDLGAVIMFGGIFANEGAPAMRDLAQYLFSIKRLAGDAFLAEVQRRRLLALLR